MSIDEPDKGPDLPATKPSKPGSFGKGVLAGVFGLSVVNYIVQSEDRYPLRVEYELAKTCIDGSGFRMSKDQYRAQQEQCLCSLEATMKDVAFEKYRKENQLFFSAFGKHKAVCENKGRR